MIMRKWEKGLMTGILLAGSVVMLLPFYWMVSTSLKKMGDVVAIPPVWFPIPPQWDNFGRAWHSAPFHLFFINSIIVSVVTTILTVVLCAAAGYGFAKFRFVGRRTSFLLILSTMMVPGQITMIPVYLLMRDLHLLNTHWSLILMGLSSGFGVFLMRQFISQLPDELLESARMDGGNEYMLFIRIVLPLIQPAIAALAIFSFMGSWDAFFWPLIFLDSESMFTLPLGIARFQGEYSADIRMIMAASLFVIVPVVAVFVVFQRSFIQGVTFTAVKG